MLKGYKYTFFSGAEYGTSVEFTWDSKTVNFLTIKFTENPKRKSYFIYLMMAVMCIFVYALTYYYYEYWLLTFVTLFICFLLTFLMIILPGILGAFLGFIIGSLLYSVTTPQEVKDHNRKDRELLHNEVMIYANELALSYRNQMQVPPVQSSVPPPMSPLAYSPAPPPPLPQTEFCPNCGCEIDLGTECPICLT